MSSSYDFYIAQLEEPTLTVVNERRALRNVPEPYEYDVEREAEWRRMQEWQWREECAKKEDERIQSQENYNI